MAHPIGLSILFRIIHDGSADPQSCVGPTPQLARDGSLSAYMPRQMSTARALAAHLEGNNCFGTPWISTVDFQPVPSHSWLKSFGSLLRSRLIVIFTPFLGKGVTTVQAADLADGLGVPYLDDHYHEWLIQGRIPPEAIVLGPLDITSSAKPVDPLDENGRPFDYDEPFSWDIGIDVPRSLLPYAGPRFPAKTWRAFCQLGLQFQEDAWRALMDALMAGTLLPPRKVSGTVSWDDCLCGMMLGNPDRSKYHGR